MELNLAIAFKIIKVIGNLSEALFIAAEILL